MASPKNLLAIIDLPGAERDALARLIDAQGFEVVMLDDIRGLPAKTALAVAHVRAVDGGQWSLLVERLPVVAVAGGQAEGALVEAIDAGVSEYLFEPLQHDDLLASLIARALTRQAAVTRQVQERTDLVEHNETLETHLAMLRLDQQAGGHIQRKLLPATTQTINGVQCAYSLTPSLYLSGDFLDFQRIDERYSVFYFADVSGHGASSAFVTVLLKYLCNRWLQERGDAAPSALPSIWLKQLNNELLDTGIGKHATVFVGVIDRELRYLHYSLGAQLPMPMLISSGDLVTLEGEGMPVGLFPHTVYPSYGCELTDDFRMWLCSDGVLECLPGSSLEQRLGELRSRIATCSDVAALQTRLGMNATEADDIATERQALPDDLTIMMLSGFDHDNA
ncbi:PP2C family protein-serine/threonine phosphatase [Halomonas sp. GXIMD04776]|uniref:PP2C family protein-serine/threonine phosphatase n=1 Tax=Halomonas sp. GXIMD04776 TaxID=3415605 RepID=UPI003C8B7554